MDRALGQAAEEFKLKWDRRKDWKNGVHLGVNLDKKKYQKYRDGESKCGVHASEKTDQTATPGKEEHYCLTANANLDAPSRTTQQA